MTPEAKVKVRVDNWLNRNMPNHFRYKPRGGPFGKMGTPDYFICWHGIFIGLEVKAEGFSITDLQRSRLQEIIAAGGIGASISGFDVAKLEMIKAAVLARV